MVECRRMQELSNLVGDEQTLRRLVKSYSMHSDGMVLRSASIKSTSSTSSSCTLRSGRRIGLVCSLGAIRKLRKLRWSSGSMAERRYGNYNDEDDEDMRHSELCYNGYIEAIDGSSSITPPPLPAVDRLPRIEGGERGDRLLWRIFEGNRPDLCNEFFRLNVHMFAYLEQIFRHKRFVTEGTGLKLNEILGMSLFIFSRCASYRDVHSIFQRSIATVNKYHYQVIDGLCELSVDVIRPYHDLTEQHPLFADSKRKYLKPFKNAIGAIDGTHCNASVNDNVGIPFYDKDGNKSWNVIAVVDFQGRFTYVNTGWQGATHDLSVLRACLTSDEENFPHPPDGMYYLVDSGYVNTEGYLAPYQGVRYHTREFRDFLAKGNKIESVQGNYNHVHSGLRGVVERTFGEMKKTWKIIAKMPQIPVKDQPKLLLAVCTLHNFIKNFKMGISVSPRPQLTAPPVIVGTSSTTSMDVYREYLAMEVHLRCLKHQRRQGEGPVDVENPYWMDDQIP